ncbi:MAG TPA: glycosyltransferase family 39 protein [Tepidisphaeraceae bacterium]|jgi:hypothetical protein|nr:glycosyltransferase family 39 protein [Tepidisphaeraceae bacterium]
MGATAVQLETPPAESPQAQSTPKKPFPWRLIILLALTCFAGFIRFAWIERPSLWNDEGHTFRRLTGTFQDLLDVLQVSGFSPLHYELYWYIGHLLGGAHKLTPFWMRVIPSLAGTLMVPAIYFLARQICSKRTSLLVAAYAACSAYLMAYSHDAKMYMHFWLFCTLNVGCLLWWFRSNRRVAWLGWIAAGVAMGGLQALGLILLAVEPLLFLAQPRAHWKRTLQFLIGLLIIAAGPVGYYVAYDRWSSQVVESGWDNAGLTWIPDVIGGREGPDLLRFATSAWLYSWEWPNDKYDPENPDQIIYGSRGRGSSEGFAGMLQGRNINPRAYAGLSTAFVLTFFLAALGLLPWPARFRGAKPDDPPTQPWSLSTFWLLAWMVIPAYAFYCLTMPDFAQPQDWINAVGATFSGHWTLLLLAILCISALCIIWRYIPIALAAILGAVTASFILAAIIKGAFYTPQPALWINAGRRIWPILSEWLLWPKYLIPTLIILPALLWYYSAPTLPQRLGRLFQFSILLLATYILLQGVVAVVELVQKNMDTGQVWMPRYMAFAWPAFAIIICALILRLPTRPLRYLAIALLLGVNLAQTWGRMFHGGEPPIDHIMHDLWAAESSNDTLRTYVAPGGSTNHPGGGNISNNPGRYYLSIERGAAWHPSHYLNTDISSVLTVRQQTSPYAISADLRRAPTVDRIIIWERFAQQPDPAPTDLVLNQLGSSWQKQSEDYFPVHFHWNWSELYVARRKIYVKKPPPPTTQQTLSPAPKNRLALVVPQDHRP